MKYNKVIKLLTAFLLLNIVVFSQKKTKKVDNERVYREFIKIGDWYNQVPFQMKLQLITRINPAAAEQDSVATEMTLFYGKSEFYMQAEGMEQIVNDSMVVLVNNEAKMIKLFPNNKEFQLNLEKTSMMFTPDSSFKSLIEKYTASSTQVEDNIGQIILRSRENVFGTDVPRELIKVRFIEQTRQPITFDQSKASLIPIDTTVFNRLSKEEKYTGKLVSTTKNGVSLYFMLKQQQTFCRFEKISRDVYSSPVKQEDRIVKSENGEYRPVKEFEGYLLSKEF